MTPAVEELTSVGVTFELHEYANKVAHGYAAEAAQSLGITPGRVFKTLVAEDPSGALLVAVVPTSQSLNLKKLARAAGVKKVKLTEQATAERVTDGRRGLEIEIAPDHLATICEARVADLC